MTGRCRTSTPIIDGTKEFRSGNKGLELVPRVVYAREWFPPARDPRPQISRRNLGGILDFKWYYSLDNVKSNLN